MTVLKMGHVGMTVSDLDRSMDFYNKLFGFKEFFRVRRKTIWLSAQVGYPEADVEFCHMRGANGLHLELLKYWNPPGVGFLPDDTFIPGNAHVNFWVDDADEMAAKIGNYIRMMDDPGFARFAPNPLDIPASTITDGPQTGGKGFYMRDPDGHTIEIWQPAKSQQAQGFGQ